MDDLIEGMQYFVNTAKGLNLRREPTTKDGKRNIIISMPNGAIVTLESVEVQTRDGYTWYNVRYEYEDSDKNDEIGWAAKDYLLGVGLGGDPDEYTFVFDNKTRTITKPNLKAALAGNKISKSELVKNQIEISLDKPFKGNTKYWVTKDNLKDVTITPKIT